MAGRPPFKPTDKDRRRVSIAAGGGMGEEDLALALGISRGTLRKHFELELTTGRACRRMEVTNALFKAAKEGNVAACKLYIAGAPQKGSEAPTGSEFKEPPKGKKARADEDAKTAQKGTEWGDLLPSPSRQLQ